MKPIEDKKPSKDGIIEITGGWSDFTYPSQKMSFWGVKETKKEGK